MLLCKRAALWLVGVLRIDGKCSGHAACISLDYEARNTKWTLRVTAKRIKTVKLNIMTFMATDLKRSPRQACVREQGVGGGEHAGDIQRVWQSVAGPNSDASLTASSA